MARPKNSEEMQTKLVSIRMRNLYYENLKKQNINLSKLVNGLVSVYLNNADEAASGPARNRTPNLRCVRATS